MDNSVCKNVNGQECQLRTRFKAGNEIIYVVKSEAEEIPQEAITTSGERIRMVILGSPQHLEAIQVSINDLKWKISKFELQNNPQKREKAEEALQGREKELMFLKENCSRRSAESQATDATSTAFEGSEQGSTDGSFEESAPVIHVTAETFGQIAKLKVIEHKKSYQLFPAPAIRQYIIDGVIHRSNHHMHVQWLELFIDLIYVGTVQKAGHYIEKGGEAATVVLNELSKLAGNTGDISGGTFNKLTWKYFLYFVLIFGPILQRWRTQTYLVNQIRHAGPVPKVSIFKCSSLFSF